jgi:hypothetical protein
MYRASSSPVTCHSLPESVPCLVTVILLSFKSASDRGFGDVEKFGQLSDVPLVPGLRLTFGLFEEVIVHFFVLSHNLVKASYFQYYHLKVDKAFVNMYEEYR